jgi:hypothetical protein
LRVEAIELTTKRGVRRRGAISKTTKNKMPESAPSDMMNPLAPQQLVHEEDGDPSFLYTSNGFFQVPHYYIERDTNKAVVVRQETWQKMKALHCSFNAIGAVSNVTVRQENIVVLTQANAFDPTGRPLLCHWALRVAIDTGNERFLENPGANFLWVLPFTVSTKIVEELRRFEMKEFPNSTHGTSLTRHLTPTGRDLDVSEWAGFRKVEKLTSYYDIVFAMSVRPSKSLVAAITPNEELVRSNFARPKSLQKHRNSPLAGMNDDVFGLVFWHLVRRCARSSAREDWVALLKARAVNKQFRNVVDEGAKSFVVELRGKIRNALTSGHLEHVFLARDACIDTGVTVLPFLFKTENRQDFLSLAAVRTSKEVVDVPIPRPPTCRALSPLLSRDNRIFSPIGHHGSMYGENLSSLLRKQKEKRQAKHRRLR